MSFFFQVKEIYTLPSLPMSPWQLSCKEPTCNVEEVGLIPSLEKFPGEGNGHLCQYSCLGNLMTEEPGGLQSMGSQMSQNMI